MTDLAAAVPLRAPAAGDARDRLRLAHEAAGLGMWEWEVEAGVLHWDDGARALHGVSPDEEVTLELLLSRIHPADRERIRAAMEAAVDPAVRGPCDVRYRVDVPDGSERWIQASGRVEWGPDAALPRAVRVLGVVRDDTRVRAAERALAERDERLRAALYASGTGTFRWDIRTNALDWDENLDRLFGLVPGTTVRSLDGFLATVHPDDRARVIAACARCAAVGADFDEEFRVVWPDGSVRWLDDKGRTFLDADGRPAYMTGACVDITERKRATEERERLLEAERAANLLARQRLAELERATQALRDSEGRLRRILESGIVGAFFWSVDGPISEANDAFLELMGYTRDDLRAGRIDWRRLTPARWQAEDERKVAELVETGRHGPYAKEYLAADGTAVPVIIASAFFEGSRTEGVALCLDRTRQVRAEQALEAARAEAESANQAKSAFLASMSHELRTPLNAIAGYVELMEMGIRGPVTDAQRDDLARIRRSARHLLGLINDVLSFARIDAGSLTYDIVEIELGPLVVDAEAMVAPQSAAKGLRLAIHRCVPGVRVCVDPDKVQQILLNLLGNAIKFTPSGGSIEVTCEADAERVRVHVRDSGVGIPPEKQAAVFEPFVQLNRSASSPGEGGVGLGLAISRELARAMGGDLSLMSEPGTGSTFTLTLAAAPPRD